MDPLLACAGYFPFIAFFDPLTLEERDRLPAKETLELVQVPFPDDPSRLVIAVGEREPPFDVRLCDISARTGILSLSGLDDFVTGLATLSSSSSSDPLLVIGDSRHFSVLVFNGQTGKRVCSFPSVYEDENEDEVLAGVEEIHAVSEWDLSDIFVCRGDEITRYDVSREMRLGTYSEHRDFAQALSAIPSRNVLLSGSQDQTVKMWSRDEYYSLTSLSLSNEVNSLYYSDNLILAGLWKGGVEVWDCRQTGQKVRQIPLSRCVSDIDQIDEKLFVSGSEELCAVWNPKTGEVVEKTKMPSIVNGVCLCDPSRGERSSILCEEENARLLYVLLVFGNEKRSFEIRFVVEGRKLVAFRSFL